MRLENPISFNLAVMIFCLCPVMGQSEPVQPSSFALVELFTSQGCSSCPPADAYLSQLTARGKRGNQAIFTLSFHVDYWDYLGWADPFANPEFTQRQRDYARDQNTTRIYTPQMMINGKWPFVGSDRDAGERLLTKALAQSGGSDLPIKISAQWEAATVDLTYETKAGLTGFVVNLAVVERGLLRKVARGENRGRKLNHDNVVRAFETQKLNQSGKGEASLQVPADVSRDHAQLVVYVQKKGPGKIVAANAIDL